MKAQIFTLPALVLGLVIIVVFAIGFGLVQTPVDAQKVDAQDKVRKLEGILRMEIREYSDGTEPETVYYIPVDEEKNLVHYYIDLNAAKERSINLDSMVNKQVALSGTGDMHSFKLALVDSVVSPAAMATNTPATPSSVFSQPQVTRGDRTILFMMAYHGSAPSTSYTPEQIKEWGMSTTKPSAKSWLKNTSFGYVNLKGVNDVNGDVTPWMRIGDDTSNCGQNISNEWRWQADSMAEAMGYSRTDYKFRVLIYAPIPGCSITAFASVGTFGDPVGITHVFIQLGPTGLLSDLENRLFTLMHELTHNLGQAEHSKGQQFAGGPIQNQSDSGDILGSNSMAMVHLVNRIKLGWTTSAQRYPELQFRGVHRLLLQSPTRPAKGIGPNIPAVGAIIELRNLDGSLHNEVLVVETTDNIAEYNPIPSDAQAYVQGVAVRRVAKNLEWAGTGTVIIDSTPLTPCCKDAPVKFNQTLSLPEYGVTISPTQSYPRRMWVNIVLGSNYPN